MNLLRVLFQATLRSQLQAAEQQLQQESIIERFGIWNGIVFVFVFFVFFFNSVCNFPFCHFLFYACPLVFFHVFVYVSSTLIESFILHSLACCFVASFSVSPFFM